MRLVEGESLEARLTPRGRSRTGRGAGDPRAGGRRARRRPRGATSCTATSSRPTSCSPAARRPRSRTSSTSASPARRPPWPARRSPRSAPTVGTFDYMAPERFAAAARSPRRSTSTPSPACSTSASPAASRSPATASPPWSTRHLEANATASVVPRPAASTGDPRRRPRTRPRQGPGAPPRQRRAHSSTTPGKSVRRTADTIRPPPGPGPTVRRAPSPAPPPPGATASRAHDCPPAPRGAGRASDSRGGRRGDRRRRPRDRRRCRSSLWQTLGTSRRPQQPPTTRRTAGPSTGRCRSPGSDRTESRPASSRLGGHRTRSRRPSPSLIGDEYLDSIGPALLRRHPLLLRPTLLPRLPRPSSPPTARPAAAADPETRGACPAVLPRRAGTADRPGQRPGSSTRWPRPAPPRSGPRATTLWLDGRRRLLLRGLRHDRCGGRIPPPLDVARRSRARPSTDSTRGRRTYG